MGSKRGDRWRPRTRRKPRVEDSRCCKAVLQPAKFEETWKSWEHQVDVYENLSSTMLDDDVKISVVLRECPQKLRDHLLVNSQQFESDNNKLRAIIQTYLNTKKTWIVNDFRETVPMDLDLKARAKAKAKARTIAKVKAVEKLIMTKSATCAERRVISHETVGHEQITKRW